MEANQLNEKSKDLTKTINKATIHIYQIYSIIIMAQLHFYLPDHIAEKLKNKAKKAHLSVSKYMAEIAKREVENEWPEGYFELFGQWQGEELERAEQLPYEQRETFN